MKPFFQLFVNIYTGLGFFIRTTYHFNSQSMGRPDKRKTTEDSRSRHQRFFVEKGAFGNFVNKILQENTCVGVSF